MVKGSKLMPQFLKFGEKLRNNAALKLLRIFIRLRAL
jgi:hypothetical protein